VDLHNQHALEGAADRAHTGYLRRSSGSMVTTGFLAAFAGLAAVLAFTIGDDADRTASIVIFGVVATAAMTGVVVATWRAEVGADRIVFKGLLCPLNDVSLRGIAEETICRYKWEGALPRLERQCIELRYAVVAPTQLRWFWRRSPWGDEASDHPDLIAFAAAVRTERPTS
jgi:hypothetical protein